MKAIQHDTNVISIAAVDLFASGMGAFILMALTFMLFFPNTGASPAEIPQPEPIACPPVPDPVSCPPPVTCPPVPEPPTCPPPVTCPPLPEPPVCPPPEPTIVRQPFVLVTTSWADSGDKDIDLHVVDPQGRRYYFRQTRHPGSDAVLEVDSVNGPGNEVWVAPNPMPGNYEIYLDLYSGGSVSAVRGSIVHQQGRVAIPQRFLSEADGRTLVARVNVAADGSVSVNLL